MSFSFFKTSLLKNKLFCCYFFGQLKNKLDYFLLHNLVTVAEMKINSTRSITERKRWTIKQHRFVIVRVGGKRRLVRCGSVGRVVASDARGPRFESSRRQTFISVIFCLLSTVLKRQKQSKRWLRLVRAWTTSIGHGDLRSHNSAPSQGTTLDIPKQTSTKKQKKLKA